MENNTTHGNYTEAQKKSMAVGPWRLAWDRFKKNKVALVGGILFAIILLSIIFIPLLSPYEINQFDLAGKNQPPSAGHWLGTDEQGRDVMLRIFLGGRISIRVGLMAAGVTVILGAMVGGIAGYYEIGRASCRERV